MLTHAEDVEDEPNQLARECSCGKYSEYLALCVHAIACIQYVGKHPYLYFYWYYYRRAYNNNYHYPLQPSTIQALEIQSNDIVLPPIKRAKRERPKVARIRANYREEGGFQRRIYTCSVCH
jgi:hypothetical protein